MKIGILGAMAEEVSSIKKLMTIDNEQTIADRVYVEGKITGVDIVLTFSRWGKVAAATTASILINKFNVQFVLFIGVAGAIDNNLNIGDIVVGDGLYQHDMDARPFFSQFQIPLTSTTIFRPRKEDVLTAKLVAEKCIKSINHQFQLKVFKKYKITNPQVYTGLIASGDKFIRCEDDYKSFLSSNTQKTLAVEMEGAAVSQVCQDFKVAYIVIRTISDKADHSAVIDFQSFIIDIASLYSFYFVKEYLMNFKF